MRLEASAVTSVFRMPLLLASGRTEDISVASTVYWILRVSCAMNFIFHGLWGVLGKASWVKLFAVGGIGEEAAYPLMHVIGVVDIIAGMVILFAPARLAPVRAVLVYIVVWGMWTALLRPLAGSAWWYFFERAANFAPPLALLLYTGLGNSIKDWFKGVATPALTQDKIEQIKWVFRLAIGAFLITHGGYGAIEGRQFLIGHFASVGLPGLLTDPETFLIATGVFEMALGALVLINPMRPILVVVLVWEVFINLLFVTSGLGASGIRTSEHAQGVWIISTLERFGMYGAPAVLFMLMGYRASSPRVKPVPVLSGAAARPGSSE